MSLELLPISGTETSAPQISHWIHSLALELLPIAGTETLLDKFGTAIDTFLLELLPHCGDGNCNIHITHSLSSL